MNKLAAALLIPALLAPAKLYSYSFGPGNRKKPLANNRSPNQRQNRKNARRAHAAGYKKAFKH